MTTSANRGPAVLRSREIIGRDVVDAAGSKVGSIRDLLLDRRDGTIRYLEVDLGVMRNKVLVPVRHVDWGRDAFVLHGFPGQQLKHLPTYEGDEPFSGDMLDELAWAYPSFYGDEVARPVAPGGVNPGFVSISEARDFKIPKGEPDVRNWHVFGSDGERVGTVADLLVDPGSMKVAYLVVDLMDDLFLLKDDRHVLVPAEAADLKERGDDVWIRGLPAREVARLPAYSREAADPLVFDRVDEAFHPDGETNIRVSRGTNR
jgi:sporulation protein YlmC with PRC-barrel domain